MIFPVDTIVNFSGPRACDQALAFCDDCSTGAAVLVADGTQVKMLRSVIGEFRLAEKSEVRAWGRGDAIKPAPVVAIFALLFFFVLGSPSGAAAADTMLGNIGSAPAAVLAQAAAALPDPKGYESLGWLIAGLAGIVLTIGGIIAAIIGGLTLIDKIRGTSKVQATTKESDDGPTRTEYNLHLAVVGEVKAQRKEDMGEIKAALKELNEKMDARGGEQYKARGRMHRKMNTLENAMHFWAGKLAGSGDPDAKRLVGILEAQKHEEEIE